MLVMLDNGEILNLKSWQSNLKWSERTDLLEILVVLKSAEVGFGAGF